MPYMALSPPYAATMAASKENLIVSIYFTDEDWKWVRVARDILKVGHS
jgi:hypothetical protein